MPQPLMPVGGLIRQSWEAFLKHWNETLRISLWFLLAPVLFLPVIFMGNAATSTLDWYSNIVSLAGALITIWATLRLTLVILAENRGGAAPKDEMDRSKKLFWPFLWVNLLAGLAVLGGFLLFVFPGIWLSVTLAFARFQLIEDGTHGTQALAASHALVKGRWWPTFWRLFWPGLLFTVLLMIAVGIVAMIVAAIAGFNKIGLVLGSGTNVTPAADAVRYLLQGVGQAVFMPLFVWWPVKLYHNLRDTK